jgi:stress response protein YsnF
LEREIDAAPPIRTEGDVTIIPVVEEILVVEKRLMLREEIHVRQTATTQSVEVPVTLRKQEAVIDRQDVTTNANEEEL